MSSNIRSIEEARAKTDGLSASLGRLVNNATPSSVNPKPAFLVLLAQQDIPIKQSFLISKIAKSVLAEVESYQASHKLLCEKYANKDNEGKAIILDGEGKRVSESDPGRYDIPPDKMPEFNREHQELLETEVSIPGQRIKVSDLEGAKIAPAHVMMLDWLLED